MVCGGICNGTHQGFGLLDVFMAEKELSIQVTEVDSVQIDDMDFAEACKDKVFQELAADATSTNQEYARLRTKNVKRQYPIKAFIFIKLCSFPIIKRAIPP